MEAALALLGDGPGLTGFHATLRTATMIYAGQCHRGFRARDDESLKTRIRDLIDAAPKRADRKDVSDYQSDHYLNRLIDGAFALVATGDTDAPATMAPDVRAPIASVEQARADLRTVIRGFLNRTTAWWSVENPADPEHGAVIVDVGTGKSAITREELPTFIAAQKAAGKPWRVLWLVPHHRLSEEAADAMRALGVNAAIMKGREAKVTPDAPETMCQDLKAVSDAILIGADVERDVCGTGKGGKPVCPFRDRCAYQQQKDALKAADVVVAAHQHLFHKPPAAMGKNFGLVVVDESWWQAGLNPGRKVHTAGFEDTVIKTPPLRDAKKNPQPDPLATQQLRFLSRKAEAVFAATPVGQFVTRATVIATGLTSDGAREAAKLEWLRKRNPGIHPGMRAKDREKAVEDAKVNASLSRRHDTWRALAELLDSNEEGSGRLQMAEGRHGPELLLHSRREIYAGTEEHPGPVSLPILLLDATLPPSIVNHFLPRLAVLATVRVATPFMTVNQVIGGWGKTSLIPHEGAKAEENERRNGILSELRDFVALHGNQSALTITYEAIEDRLADLIGVRTAHFNAITGLDTFGNVETQFVIGRPLPAPAELRELALALTGRVIPEGNPGQVTRGALMTDGTGRPLKVRAYSHPDLEALRAAITDAAMVQGIGRGRGCNRTAANPLTVWVLADTLLPHPLATLTGWGDVQLNAVERMAARGLVLSSPSDAALFFPDLFENRMAAANAFRGISVCFPYEGYPHRGITHKSVAYRPAGRGQQTRQGFVADWRLDTVRDDLEDVLGTLALFELGGEAPAAESEPVAQPAPEPAIVINAQVTASIGPIAATGILERIIGEIPPFPLLDDWELNPDNPKMWDKLSDSARIALKVFHDLRMQTPGPASDLRLLEGCVPVCMKLIPRESQRYAT